MNLENFDQKTSLIINTAFSYASENNYAYFTPLNILEVMVKTDTAVKSTLNAFSININELYRESQDLFQKSKKNISNEDTLVKGNIIMLMDYAFNESKKLNFKKVNSNILLLALTSDISPHSKLLIEKFGLNYEKLFKYLSEKKQPEKEEFEFIKKFTTDITDLALNNKIDPIIGREEEIKRTNVPSIYLLTADQDIANNKAYEISQHNINLVVYKSVKQSLREYRNVISFEDYFYEEIPSILNYWNEN